MSSFVLKDRDGIEKVYQGNTLTVPSTEGEKIKFYALENPVSLLVEGVNYTLENASEPEKSDEEIYTIQIN